MTSEWSGTTLGKLIRIKHGFAFKGEHFTDQNTGWLVTTPGNFAIGGGFQESKPKYYAGEVPSNYILRSGQLIVTMTDLSKSADTLGYSAVVPDSQKHKLLHNQRIGLVERLDGVDADLRYLGYVMRWHRYRDHVVATATGSTVKHTSPGRIYAFRFEAPPKEEQSRIADLLGVLDDRIDHNRALAANLEAIAHALFKSWFVDFDPVRDKAAGKAPAGLAPDLAALFPDRFVDSELGEIPEGWACRPITEISVVHSGGTPKRAHPEYWGGSVPWYSVVDAPQAGEVFVIETSEQITEAGLANSAAKALPEGVTIISARGTVGKLALTCGPMTINQSCYALKGKLGDFFTYFTVATSIDWLKQNVHGAVFDTITRATLDALMIIRPNDDVAQAYEDIVRPIMQKIETCGREVRALTQIRDLLLPRLISGKLRVEDAEAALEVS